MKSKITIKDITLIAILAAILFVQEQVFSYLPIIQLTVLLLVLYSKHLGIIKTLIIITIHVILDNLISGYFNPILVLSMIIGWSLIPILLCSVFKKVNSNISLALLGILFSFLYCWVIALPHSIVMEVDLITYLTMDIIWEFILAASSFITIVLLYKPLSKLFDKLNICKS